MCGGGERVCRGINRGGLGHKALHVIGILESDSFKMVIFKEIK